MRAARLVASLLVVAAAAIVACSGRAPSAADDGLCATILRTPSADVEVMSLGDDGRPVVVEATCGRVGCLRGRADAVAVVQPDGTVWAAWQGRPGGVLDGAQALADAPPVERWARTQVLAAQSGPSAAAVGALPPTLPKELRTCGTTEAGGGLGWHVIRNEGDVWQRIHWGVPPASPEVLALGDDAYPLATEAGALCAFAVQDKPRAWRVHLKSSGRVVVAAPDNEHPPARCRPGGAVEVRRADGLFRYAQDGTETKVEEPVQVTLVGTGGAQAGVSIEGTASIARPTGVLRVHGVDGAVRELPLPVDHDLAGGPLPKGAVRERLLTAGDGAATLLVVERIQRADCSVTEALHLVRTDAAPAATVTRISEGDVVYAKPIFAAGRFYWLEARPQVVDIAQGVARPAL